MHSLWAIAKNTLSQAIRMRAAGVIIVLLLVLLPLMSVVMDGDGTLLGKLQTFVSYGLGLVSFLLCILTIAVSAYTLSNDLKRRHLYLVVTKPIRRWEVVAGKLLGILILNIFLLTIFGVIIYTLTMMIPGMVQADPYQRERAKVEFFTARTGLKVKYDETKLQQAAEKRFLQLKESGQLPGDMSQVRILLELIGQERMMAKSCPPGQAKRWDFQGVSLKNSDDPDALLFIRYKFEPASPIVGDTMYGLWRVGDLRQLDAGIERLATPIYYVERDGAPRTYHELVVPANAVADDGYFAVEFFNNPAMNPTTIILNEVEVLFHSGTFTTNYIRALLMIYVRLVFLAALGVSLTTWLSFPVAMLICLVAFFAGTANTFIIESFDGMGLVMGMVYMFTLRPLLWMIPQFDGLYNPSSYIINGRLIAWSFLSMMVVVTLFVKAMAVLLFGMWVFSRREIAKAVV